MKTHKVLGVMSGTSLDGIDIAEIQFNYATSWSFELKTCETIAYSDIWIAKLKNAHTNSKEALEQLNEAYTEYLAQCINTFITKHKIENLDAVCSHGHTILHEPQNNYTLQIGNLVTLSQLIQQNVVCDFRVQDVQLGGQGAPLVPIGDQLLFSNYDVCLNLGGFANISLQQDDKRIAFDNCPVNTVLNYYAQQLGKPFDYNGDFSRKGNLNKPLLAHLNELEYYKKAPPKSLGIEWVASKIIPLINSYSLSPEDCLHTFSVHVAQIITQDIVKYTQKENPTVLVTGGGAYNSFMIAQLNEYSNINFEIPAPKVIEFKEALIFGLLGVLKLNNSINVLSSVTGSIKNHSSGKVFLYENDTDLA